MHLKLNSKEKNKVVIVFVSFEIEAVLGFLDLEIKLLKKIKVEGSYRVPEFES